MSLLLSPLKINTITLKNRMAVSSMCMYSANDGYANDFHLVHLGARAVGGYGLIMEEATAVSPEGRISYKDLGLWEDGQIPMLKRIVDFCHTQNARIGIQLAHAGRKASQAPSFIGGAPQIPPETPNGWQTYAPSPIPFRKDENPPVELDVAGLNKVKQEFILAALRAKEIGYDVLELHAAHGYLFHQFYSPLSNQRKDEYGGSFENRIRFLLDTIREVKVVWGKEKPLFVRLSATDWHPDGWKISDSIRLANLLKELGVDLVDVSSAGNLLSKDSQIPKEDDNYQVDLASAIKKETGILVGAVGRIRTVSFSESILQQNKADLIFYARESLRQPNFPLSAANLLGEETEWPKQYLRAKAQTEALKTLHKK